jgi:hypothetical protein
LRSLGIKETTISLAQLKKVDIHSACCCGYI